MTKTVAGDIVEDIDPGLGESDQAEGLVWVLKDIDVYGDRDCANGACGGSGVAG